MFKPIFCVSRLILKALLYLLTCVEAKIEKQAHLSLTILVDQLSETLVSRAMVFKSTHNVSFTLKIFWYFMQQTFFYEMVDLEIARWRFKMQCFMDQSLFFAKSQLFGTFKFFNIYFAQFSLVSKKFIERHQLILKSHCKKMSYQKQYHYRSYPTIWTFTFLYCPQYLLLPAWNRM